MPAKSEKQANLFRIVRGLQTGKIKPSKVSGKARKMARTIKPSSVKHFTRVKEIVDRVLTESEYSLSKIQTVKDSSFSELLRKNVGVPFDTKELLVFQSKQQGFGGFGQVKFNDNGNHTEISTKLASNESNKDFAFKKLVDEKNPSMNIYGCFIQKSYNYCNSIALRKY
jgi:hypothetical protein